jgi:hypothetical protein
MALWLDREGSAMKASNIHANRRNGTRWSDAEWLKKDLEQITEVYGPLPVNHRLASCPAHYAFAKWLDKVVKPETFEVIMASPNAFHNAYAAYSNLVEHEARNNRKSKAHRAESTN